MKTSSLLKTAFLGASIYFTFNVPLQAESVLRVMEAASSGNVNVTLNRAVVMESDVTFAELSVANPGIADIATLSANTIYILGKAPGRTTLTLLDENGRLITNVEIRVAPDLLEFKERLKEILPDEEIEVRTANSGIVLSGRVSGAQKIDRALQLAEQYAPERVTNFMSVGGTQQVMLKVRFAEMQRSVSKALHIGIGTGLVGTTGGQITSGTVDAGTNYSDIFSGANPIVSSNERASSAILNLLAGNFRAALMIEALEKKGLVRTLAEPNLVAISGQSASFLAGGEYPIPVASDNGTVVEYKEFGIRMGFTPVVVDSDLIRITLDAEVSSIDTTVSVTAGGFSVNGFKTRSTSTSVELRDGQSFAIAGLLEDDFTDSIAQLPLLGDLPILGSLFRSTDYARKQSELVILITAHLVSPTRGEALSLPTDRIRIPTEGELFFLGRTAGGVANLGQAQAEVAKQDFSTSYGYVME
ncbi:MAG: pilus assembly protein CpaC [Planctomycetota bacterium]|jgi:pilus assembly protein CpaC